MASIFVVWIPLVGLYFLSIGLSWLVYLKKNRKNEKCRSLSVTSTGFGWGHAAFCSSLPFPAGWAQRDRRKPLTAGELLRI